MILETCARIATIVVALELAVPLVKSWWNKPRRRTRFVLGSKTRLTGNQTRIPKFELGYLFVSYKTTHESRWHEWWYGTVLDYFYSLADKLSKIFKFFKIVSFTGRRNNLANLLIRSMEASDSTNSVTTPLAFCPIKEFDQIPDWAESSTLEKEAIIYFKSEDLKQNWRNLRSGIGWVECETPERCAAVNINYTVHRNRLLEIPKSKKIKKLLKKGFRKQFWKGKIGSIVVIKRKSEL